MEAIERIVFVPCGGSLREFFIMSPSCKIRVCDLLAAAFFYIRRGDLSRKKNSAEFARGAMSGKRARKIFLQVGICRLLRLESRPVRFLAAILSLCLRRRNFAKIVVSQAAVAVRKDCRAAARRLGVGRALPRDSAFLLIRAAPPLIF